MPIYPRDVVDGNVGRRRLLLRGRRRRRHVLLEEGRRAWRGRERRAWRAVRGGEGQHGEALTVLLIQGDQALQLLLDVVHLMTN